MACVSYGFRRLAYDKNLWKAQCKRRWKLSWWGSKDYTELGESLTNEWRAIYASRLHVEKRWEIGDCRVAVLDGHHGAVDGLHFNDERLLSVGEDALLRVWELRTGRCIAQYEFDAMAVCVQFEGHTAAVGLWNGSIRLLDFRTGVMLQEFTGHLDGVRCLQFHGDWLASGSFDHSVRVWNRRNGECVRTLQHSGPVTALQYDQVHIVAGSSNGTIRVWSVASGECLMTITTNTEVWSLQFDSAKIIAGTGNGTVQIFGLRTGTLLHELAGHTASVTCLQFQDDRLVTGAEDGTIRLWDLRLGACIAVLTAHRHAVVCLQFDDTKIVSGGGAWDRTIRVWDFAYGIGVDQRAVVDTAAGEERLTPNEQIVSVVDDFASMAINMDVDEGARRTAALTSSSDDEAEELAEYLEDDPYFDNDIFVD